MNCQQFKEKTLDFLYEEVSEEERQELTGHVQSCSRCRDEVNSLKLVRNEMAEWKDPAERAFPVAIPYPSPWSALKQWLVPGEWSWRSAASFAMAAGFIVLCAFSILGTEIHISNQGFEFRADLFRSARPRSNPNTSIDRGVISPAASSNQSISTQEVAGMIQASETRQQQLLRSEEERLVNQLTNSYRTQLTGLTRTMDSKHRLDLANIYDNLEQQRLADLQRIRLTFSSLDERTAQQAQQTQQLVDIIQKASYQPK
ncbi:MAG: hypothetical protein PHX83_16055 [Acidobacteriia bacterium]|nr:hypothetical protein [Terriglobia bacterium]